MKLICTGVIVTFTVLELAGCQSLAGLISLDPASNEVPANLLKRPTQKPQKRKMSRKDRCCSLGREMAKIGEACVYATTLASIAPNNEHFHKMKTKIWIHPARPFKNVRLRKCKKYKVAYEKCCAYEADLIDQDLKRMLNRLQEFFEKRRRKGRRGKSKKRMIHGKTRQAKQLRKKTGQGI
ncbi:uncharacterized protein LOC116617915 [Nematostella vectensis]|nr:uncharacterized protein LOC116617915 [Nematostella vectensis]